MGPGDVGRPQTICQRILIEVPNKDASPALGARGTGAAMTNRARDPLIDQAALNFSAYWVRSSANQDGSTGRHHMRSSASPG